MTDTPTEIPITLSQALQHVGERWPWRKGSGAGAAAAWVRRSVAVASKARWRLAAALSDIVQLARDRDSRARPAPADLLLLGARSEAEGWRLRAEAAEARAAALESRLAEAEMTALELRSRVVCLQGKLATTTATARYQSMTLALEGRPPESRVAAIAPRQL